MFWQKFLYYCNLAGQSPNTVAAAIGIKSSGTVTGWKNGAVPRPQILARLADYFGVTVDALTVEGPGTNYDDKTLLDLFHSFNREGRGKLLDYAENMKRSGMFDPNVDYFLKGFDSDE